MMVGNCNPAGWVMRFVRWERNFQTGHMCLTDNPRSERPSFMEDAATVKEVEDFILLGGTEEQPSK